MLTKQTRKIVKKMAAKIVKKYEIRQNYKNTTGGAQAKQYEHVGQHNKNVVNIVEAGEAQYVNDRETCKHKCT